MRSRSAGGGRAATTAGVRPELSRADATFVWQSQWHLQFIERAANRKSPSSRPEGAKRHDAP